MSAPLADRSTSITSRFDTERARATIDVLCAPQFAGRRAGTPGGRLAADWIAGRLSKLGFSVDRQEVAVPSAIDLYAAPWLRVDGGGVFVPRKDFAEHPRSADAALSGTGLAGR